MKDIPLDYFACPVTKKPLRIEGKTLVSPAGEVYRYRDDHYWSFIPPIDHENDPKWKIWNALQKNGEIAYPADPEHNLGVNERADHIAFGEFCDFHGLVLDIGCGPQKNPTHFRYCARPGAVFLGIDPLVGEQPRDYLFVHGLGEYLPFRNDLFDQALFVTSLDHFIEPVEALLEAGRAIKPDGEICVWIGEKDKNTPKPRESPEWYRELKIPEGAEDPFHIKRFTMAEFEGYADKAELKIREKKIMAVDRYRKNIFYKLEK